MAFYDKDSPRRKAYVKRRLRLPRHSFRERNPRSDLSMLIVAIGTIVTSHMIYVVIVRSPKCGDCHSITATYTPLTTRTPH